MAQANNRGFNQDYSCANSREFLPYLLLVSHWMPEWIWAKQGRQMDNKTWSKIRQREQIQPMMRQFDVCSANQESKQGNASWNFFLPLYFVKTFKVILCPQMSRQNQRSVIFQNCSSHGRWSEPDPNFNDGHYFNLIKAASVPIKGLPTLEK